MPAPAGLNPMWHTPCAETTVVLLTLTTTVRFVCDSVRYSCTVNRPESVVNSHSMLDPALFKPRLENGIQCISRSKCKPAEVCIGSNLIASAYLY